MPTTEQARDRLAKIKSKKPQTARLSVCSDPSLFRELEEARTSGDAETTLAIQRMIDEQSTELVFTSVGRRRHDELVLLCPPTEEQHEQARKEAGTDAPYDVDRFSPLLIAASIAATDFSPYTEEEQWQELTNELLPTITEWMDTWNIGEFLPLWTTAVAVNTVSHVRAVGKASG